MLDYMKITVGTNSYFHLIKLSFLSTNSGFSAVFCGQEQTTLQIKKIKH